MKLQQTLLEKLMPGHDPFKDFDVARWAGTWYNDPAAKNPILRTAINFASPGIVIEVGSFVGESTIYMAEHLRARGSDAVILCVDTWLGGFDHWARVPEKLRPVHGRPSLYSQFLGNIIQRGFSDLVAPLTLDSMNAARVIAAHGITADMVFVDGSHELGDVERDLESYWTLIKPRGAMVVDDANGGFAGVYHDLHAFIDRHDLRKHLVMDGEKAMITKP